MASQSSRHRGESWSITAPHKLREAESVIIRDLSRKDTEGLIDGLSGSIQNRRIEKG